MLNLRGTVDNGSRGFNPDYPSGCPSPTLGPFLSCIAAASFIANTFSEEPRAQGGDDALPSSLRAETGGGSESIWLNCSPWKTMDHAADTQVMFLDYPMLDKETGQIILDCFNYSNSDCLTVTKRFLHSVSVSGQGQRGGGKRVRREEGEEDGA